MAKAVEIADEVRLMTPKEMIEAFPEARMWQEKFAGLTKSYVAIGGF